MRFSTLAAEATRKAMRTRADHGIGPADSICPYDFSEKLGVVVRIVEAPSLEGMYAPASKPTIVLNSLRPPGRRRFTCGHELGHHMFRHGARLDEIDSGVNSQWNPEEYLAHRFAAALLMPKLAVEAAFVRRGQPLSGSISADTAFIVAQELGVGFTTLVGYMHSTLSVLSASDADRLRKTPLKKLRSEIAGFEVGQDLVLADRSWGCKPIDIEVGDTVILDSNSDLIGACAEIKERPLLHLVATQTGLGQVSLGDSGRVVCLRVSRRGFTGLARYRHLEDSDDAE